mmetsp:Transcript_53612/g.89116  ORF Transcript_53612/g.89116 Transcript_53612/m.89116 type:complete len:97 (-) Transcript_53612:67-357(-)
MKEDADKTDLQEGEEAEDLTLSTEMLIINPLRPPVKIQEVMRVKGFTINTEDQTLQEEEEEEEGPTEASRRTGTMTINNESTVLRKTIITIATQTG